ncbi:MAG: hypothetical protein ABI042_05355 [Verrucomicrobiota bacterium]
MIQFTLRDSPEASVLRMEENAEGAVTKKIGRLTYANRPFVKEKNYFVSSFFGAFSSAFGDFGVHFSQTFPALVASTQQGWAHASPLALAFSQQVFLAFSLPSAMAELETNANAHVATANNLMSFIWNFLYCHSRIHFSRGHSARDRIKGLRLPILYNMPLSLSIEIQSEHAKVALTLASRNV